MEFSQPEVDAFSPKKNAIEKKTFTSVHTIAN